MNKTAPADERPMAAGAEYRLLSVLPFRMERISPSRKSQPHWMLEMFTAGRLSISITGGPWRTFGRGEGVLYAPRTIYRERAAPGSKVCESYCLMFDVERGQTAGPLRSLVGGHRAIQDPQGLLPPLIGQALHHHQLPGADALLARGAFLQVIGHLLRAAPVEGSLIITESRRHETLLMRAHRFMKMHLHESLSIADIAEAMEMSASGFAHAYKRQAGVAPMIELRRLRVESAGNHLSAGRYSLARIAALTGFADAFHLSRTFKRVTGQTPRDFRRRAALAP